MKMKRATALFLFLAMLFAFSCCQNAVGPPPSTAPTATPMATNEPEATAKAPARFSETESFPFPNDSEIEISPSGNLILTKQQALEDYDAMWETLEENFPFFPLIQAELGLDHTEIKEKYRNELENSPGSGITLLNLWNLLDRTLSNFKSIGHLYVMSAGAYSRYSAPMQSAPEPMRRVRAILKADKVAATYAYLLSTDPVLQAEQNADAEMGAEMDAEEIKQYLIDSKYVEFSVLEDAAYLKINSFLLNNQSDPLDRGSIALDMCGQFLEENQESPNIIIDISENSGGSDLFWGAIVSFLLAEPLPGYERLLGSKAGAYNRYVWGGEEPKHKWSDEVLGVLVTPEETEWQEKFPNINPDAVADMDWLSIVESEPMLPAENSIAYEGRVWVLIGPRVYSASEQFSIFCKKTGFATLVGKTTGGSGMGCEPFQFALPNSGLLISYEAFCGFNDDGSCNAIVGTKPDIVAKDGETALEACLAAIAESGT